MKTIAFVTSTDFPAITEDDRILARQLTNHARCVGVAWDNPIIDWASFDAAVVRSCWNYHTAKHQFASWIHRTKKSSLVMNSPDLLLWNMNKRYLIQLSNSGVSIPATAWLSEENIKVSTISEIMAKNKWDRAVLKPCVSASSFQTSLLDRREISDDSLAPEHTTGEMMLQEFLTAIVEDGELSLIFFFGEFSHAVLKKARVGDFRVQHQFGGSSERIDVSSKIISAGERILDLLPEVPVYARVDGVMVKGTFTLMELELIEPVLFFRHAPPSRLERLATKIVQLLE